MLHIPILRRGQPYRSLDAVRIAHHRTREPWVEVSQANVGLIRRDLLDQRAAREALASFSVAELLGICARAAEYFLQDALPLGGSLQSPQAYVEQVSSTTGMPYVLARRNMQKIHTVLAQMNDVLDGLTRRLDLTILDAGFGAVQGQFLSFFPRANALGVVLPSNSPGVHSLWIPAVAMKIPLVLKPGSAEPWTPYRIAQALMKAGCPPEAFGYYPADHAGAAEILQSCGRSMLFGDLSSVRPWLHDPRVEIHGPGYSKIVFGEDCVDRWEQYLEVMVTSILDNAGRSCVNASGVWVPRRAAEIAEALAGSLARVVPRSADDEQAQLAPFADGDYARRLSQLIDEGLEEPGARDVSAAYRQRDRLAIFEGCAYLLPTIILCEAAEHPLANREFLFPFASVVPTAEDQLPEALGPTLVVTAITEDPKLIRRLTDSPQIGRLNLGPIPTTQVRWDQPHEGNLFDHLYARRAFQTAVSPPGAAAVSAR